MIENDTIAAVASGVGGAVTLIRVSGGGAIAAGDRIFRGVRGRRLADARGFTILYGTIRDGETVVDEVLVSVFRAPHSYTGEDMIEVSCHASAYIQREVMRLLVESGVRTAQPGEFTLRAFLAGKMDLSQAEAVADMIAADNRAAHALAYEQMRGGYSDEFGQLRGRLLELVSLVELELDFGEEDVEFADRTQLLDVLSSVGQRVDRLIASFGLGNVLKRSARCNRRGSECREVDPAEYIALRRKSVGFGYRRHDARRDRGYAEHRRRDVPVYRYGRDSPYGRSARESGDRTYVRPDRPGVGNSVADRRARQRGRYLCAVRFALFQGGAAYRTDFE